MSDSYGPPRPDETDDIARILGDAFNIPDPDEWIGTVDPLLPRVYRQNNIVVAALFLHQMGQFFGGRSVPMAGIGAVGVDVPARGHGAGAAMMKEVLNEARERRFPISTLYPATQPIYRRLGYELAGSRFHITLPLKSLRGRDREVEVRRATADDNGAIHELYMAAAAKRSGNLDRSSALWKRVQKGAKKDPSAYVLVQDGRIEGYVYYLQKDSGAALELSIGVLDFVARTPEAGRRLLAFFADHRSMVKEVTWCGDPTDPILAQLPEQIYQAKVSFHWMTRILDVPAAIEARGYPVDLSTSFDLRVHDDVFSENDGAWHVEISNGRAQCEAGGSGDIDIDVRGLASVYTGFHQSDHVRRSGRATGPLPAMLRMDAAFAGSPPWIVDMF